ncbi:MAG: VOC family protein [Rhodocyclaceae bacterium]
MQNVSTCLWFDTQAAEAAAFYVSLFPNSHIVETTHYPEGAHRPAGSVLTVQFVLDGTEYLALNGGPHYQHSPAMSMVAYVDSQARSDEMWQKLGEGGQYSQCGWLDDKFGVSWQIVPRKMLSLLTSTDTVAAKRAFDAMLEMKNIDMAVVQAAFDKA